MIRREFLALAAALPAAALAGSWVPEAALFQEKAYSNGKPLKDKPLAFADFREFYNARRVKPVTFRDIDGKGEHSLSEFSGKFVILDVWATWCEPCVRELPALIKMQKRYNREGSNIRVVPVSIDDADTDIREFLAEHKAGGYQTWRDPELALKKIIPTDVVPAAFMFDGRGNMVAFMRGYVDWDSMGVEEFLGRLAEKYAVTG